MWPASLLSSGDDGGFEISRTPITSNICHITQKKIIVIIKSCLILNVWFGNWMFRLLSGVQKRNCAITMSERRLHHYLQTDDIRLSPLRRRNRISLFSITKAIGNASMIEETDSQSDLYTNGVLSQLSRLRPLTTQRNTGWTRCVEGSILSPSLSEKITILFEKQTNRRSPSFEGI